MLALTLEKPQLPPFHLRAKSRPLHLEFKALRVPAVRIRPSSSYSPFMPYDSSTIRFSGTRCSLFSAVLYRVVPAGPSPPPRLLKRHPFSGLVLSPPWQLLPPTQAELDSLCYHPTLNRPFPVSYQCHLPFLFYSVRAY